VSKSLTFLAEITVAMIAVATLYNSCALSRMAAERQAGREERSAEQIAADITRLQGDLKAQIDHVTPRMVLFDQLIEDWPNYREKMSPVLREFPELREEVRAMHDFMVRRFQMPSAHPLPRPDPDEEILARELGRGD
jgi:hypothetical protein